MLIIGCFVSGRADIAQRRMATLSIVEGLSSPNLVDQYRPGQKMFLLISLRSVKKRGDEDEFRMAWGIRQGFSREHELWETEVRHRTQKMQVAIVFPKSRLPKRIWVEEVLHRRQHRLGEDARVMLPDERLQVTWQLDKPQLNERYQIHWEW